MADITNKRLLYCKGALFLACGVFASALLLAECPSVKVALLLATAVWCFARAYYFAFYVIQHYIDPGYRFAGLWSFARYALGRRTAAADTGAINSADAACTLGEDSKPQSRRS